MAISMKFVENLRSANEENYLDVLDPILNPSSDEVEAGKAYEELLGYDPITFHLDDSLGKVLSAITKAIPQLAVTIDEIRDSLKDAIHEEVRALKKETIASILFDTLLNFTDDLEVDIQDVKHIIEDTLDLPDLIIDPLDDEEYLLDEEEDDESDSMFDEEDDDMDMLDEYVEMADFED